MSDPFLKNLAELRASLSRPTKIREVTKTVVRHVKVPGPVKIVHQRALPPASGLARAFAKPKAAPKARKAKGGKRTLSAEQIAKMQAGRRKAIRAKAKGGAPKTRKAGPKATGWGGKGRGLAAHRASGKGPS